MFSRGALAVTAMLAAGCAFQGPVLPELAPAETTVELQHTPFFPQEDYYCGPAALATVLTTSGKPVPAAELVDKVYIPEKKGSLQIELMAATRRYGRLPYVIEPALTALLAEVNAGRPVLVFQNLGLRFYPVWHYAVAIGFDSARDEIILRSGTTKRRVMRTRTFLRTWERSNHWGLVALRPGELPAQPDPHQYLRSAADMEGIADPQDLSLIFKAAVDRWPESDAAMFALGNNYYALHQVEQARTIYTHLLEQHPEHIPARNNLAHVLSELGCYEEARSEISSALATVNTGDSLRDALVQTYEEIVTAQKHQIQAVGTACAAP